MSPSRVDHSHQSRATIAIIGGGASGTIAAIQLLRSSSAQQIILVEPSDNLGGGIAYSTSFESHLLNVPAGNMSALFDRTDHFVRWLRINVSRQFHRRSFVRRSLYGTYLRETLAQTLWRAPDASMDHYRSVATRIEADGTGARIRMENGLRVAADKVILALGHQAQRSPLPTQSNVEALSAWSPDAFQGINPQETVLLVGSGLTAVDAALALEEIGHRGAIHVISRHGKWPLVHGTSKISAPLQMGRTSVTSRSVLREIRRRVAVTGEWRGIVDGLRPHTNALWFNVSDAERSRFLRHLNYYWQIHRHRMPPEPAARVDALRRSGRLQLHPGRIIAASRLGASSQRVHVALRGGRDDLWLDVQRIINCTGPSSNLADSSNPLVKNMLQSGLARTESTQLGLLTDQNGALVGPDGLPSRSIFAIGPIRRGTLLETTAIPEISEQAARLVKFLLAGFASARRCSLAGLERFASNRGASSPGRMTHVPEE